MQVKKIVVLTLEEVRLAIAQEIAQGYKIDSIENILNYSTQRVLHKLIQ